MDLSHPFPAAERLCRAKTQDFRRILVSLSGRCEDPNQGLSHRQPEALLPGGTLFEDREFVFAAR
jgi:hypothetical protein